MSKTERKLTGPESQYSLTSWPSPIDSTDAELIEDIRVKVRKCQRSITVDKDISWHWRAVHEADGKINTISLLETLITKTYGTKRADE